jgi:hypothetical protein
MFENKNFEDRESGYEVDFGRNDSALMVIYNFSARFRIALNAKKLPLKYVFL